MSTRNSMLLTLVVAICTLALISSDIGKDSPCCTKVSNGRGRHHAITDYRIQEHAPPCVHAIIFIRQDGASMCSNPQARWVKDKVKELDSAKATTKGNRR